MSSNLYRGPLPTLTEDDVREQGERETMPPPVPISQLVAELMGAPHAVPDVELRELDPTDAANIVVEISEAYVAELGSRNGVPVMLKTAAQVCRMPLDHLSGFMLSLVDGSTTVQDILDVSTLPELRALELLCELRDLGLIEIRRRR
jgi:hypothetical protein